MLRYWIFVSFYACWKLQVQCVLPLSTFACEEYIGCGGFEDPSWRLLRCDDWHQLEVVGNERTKEINTFKSSNLSTALRSMSFGIREE